MESKVGSILALISAILGFIGAVILLIIGVLAIVGGGVLGSKTGAAGATAVGVGIGIFYIVLAIIVAILAFLNLKASKWMKDPTTTKKGGITALICGIIGGFNILSIIAGIFGLVDAGK